MVARRACFTCLLLVAACGGDDEETRATSKPDAGACSAGELPLEGDATTEHVDASYVGGGSDGSSSKPWTTIQDAVDAAAAGAPPEPLQGSSP